MTSTEQAFMDEMRNRGLDPAEAPRSDGIPRRIRDNQDRTGKNDLWYVLHDDGRPVGWFRHWAKLPDTQKWQGKHDNSMTPKERRQTKVLEVQRQAAMVLDLMQRRNECRSTAETMLSGAHDADPEHDYLKRKNIKVYGIKQLKDKLLIPLRKNGILTGLQIITADGVKRFLRGTEKAGAYFGIPGEGSTIYVVEGYATGATIHELTGSRVVVAFDCWNLEAVAKAVKVAHPECELVICADNDRLTIGNPGLTKARAAALATGAKLAIPIFSGDEGTDFNDMVAICGVGGTPCQL